MKIPNGAWGSIDWTPNMGAALKYGEVISVRICKECGQRYKSRVKGTDYCYTHRPMAVLTAKDLPLLLNEIDFDLGIDKLIS